MERLTSKQNNNGKTEKYLAYIVRKPETTEWNGDMERCPMAILMQDLYRNCAGPVQDPSLNFHKGNHLEILQESSGCVKET